MSYRANKWLDEIPAEALSNSEFRVLFKLCDAHNKETGLCCPSQAFLAGECGMSRSTVNVALAGMEASGLIRRHQGIDPVTKRQRPTHYILGCDFDKAQDPSPETGHGSGHGAESGNRTRPGPRARVRSDPRAVSDLTPEPCPAGRTLTCKEPGSNLGAGVDAGMREAAVLGFWAERINDPDQSLIDGVIGKPMAKKMLRTGLVTEAALRSRGIAF